MTRPAGPDSTPPRLPGPRDRLGPAPALLAYLLAVLLVLPSALGSPVSFQVSAQAVPTEREGSTQVPAGAERTLLLPIATQHPASMSVLLRFEPPAPRPPNWVLTATLLPPDSTLPKVRESSTGGEILLALGDINDAPPATEVPAESAAEAEAEFATRLGAKGAGAWRLEISVPGSPAGGRLAISYVQGVEEWEASALLLVSLSGGGPVVSSPLWQWTLLLLVPAATGLGWTAFRMRAGPRRASLRASPSAPEGARGPAPKKNA